MQTQDQDRRRAVDNLESGTSASLWADRESGSLLILSSVSDVETFRRRQKEGAFVSGVDFLLEVEDPLMVKAVQRLNAEAGGNQ